jgi:hypothetical protein
VVAQAVSTDFAAMNSMMKELWADDAMKEALARLLEEERELARRMEAIGPLPEWWRPFARRDWRKAANRIHQEWATWCMGTHLGIVWGRPP